MKLLILAAGVLVGAAYPTGAFACNSWDFGSSLTMQQANGPVVTLNRIRQTRRTADEQEFAAQASYSQGKGPAKGTLDRDGRLVFDVFWNNGSVGRYTAHVNQRGAVLDGRTFDQVHPESWSIWTMNRR